MFVHDNIKPIDKNLTKITGLLCAIAPSGVFVLLTGIRHKIDKRGLPSFIQYSKQSRGTQRMKAYLLFVVLCASFNAFGKNTTVLVNKSGGRLYASPTAAGCGYVNYIYDHPIPFSCLSSAVTLEFAPPDPNENKKTYVFSTGKSKCGWTFAGVNSRNDGGNIELTHCYTSHGWYMACVAPNPDYGLVCKKCRFVDATHDIWDCDCDTGIPIDDDGNEILDSDAG